MCNIRVIFKAEDNRILKDEVCQFDGLEISPVDRPSYVTCVTYEEKIYLNSYFINEDERFIDISVDTKLFLSYGELSGRIRQIVTSYTSFYETTLYRCKQSLPNVLNIRVSNNFNEYLKLYNLILKMLDSSTKFKADENLDVVQIIGEG